MMITTELVEGIKAVAALMGAIGVIFGVIFAVYRWYLRQKDQDKDIRALKEEQALICYALRACLDGLEQLGANHTVPDARERLEKHLNLEAHK